MLLPSAAGAQRRLRHWLPGTAVWRAYPPPVSLHPSPPPNRVPSLTQLSCSTASSSAGFSPHSLAWQDPNPDIASTYFLNHIVHSSQFTGLPHTSNQPTPFCHMPSASSRHSASHGVPPVCHPCNRCSKNAFHLTRACPHRLAVLLCREGFCGHTWAQ